jgi:hypothetical protein
LGGAALDLDFGSISIGDGTRERYVEGLISNVVGGHANANIRYLD